jgi:hypothetical protein
MKTPQRKCVGCREKRNKSDLIRICLAKNGQGRGAYLCDNQMCIEKAKKSKGLERSLKKTIPPDIYTKLLETRSTEVANAENSYT